MNSLPNETLIHVFSNLELKDLKTIAKVSKRFNYVISDDNCWKSAFGIYFSAYPIIRVAKTWRSEYLVRVRIARDWRKVKKLSFTPKIGVLDSLFVELETSTLYLASNISGVVAKCNLKTGRVEKDLVYSNTDQIPAPITASLLERHRVFMGLPTGFISVATNLQKDNTVTRLREFHDGPVLALQLVKNGSGLASVGQDGCVHVYNLTNMSRRLKYKEKGEIEITCLGTDKLSQLIVGTKTGILYFSNLPTLEIGSYEIRAFDKSFQLPLKSPVSRIIVDKNARLFVPLQVGTHVLECMSIETCQVIYKFVYSGWSSPDSKTTITCFEWDRRENTDGKDNQVLVTGNSIGQVHIYQISQRTSSKEIQPILIIEHLSSISDLKFDAFKVLVSSEDGDLRVYDIITGRCVQALRIRQVRHGNQQRAQNENSVTKSLWLDVHTIISLSGEFVKIWDFMPEAQTPVSFGRHKNMRTRTSRGHASRLSLSPGGASPNSVPYLGRQGLNKEIQEELNEVKAEREQEMRTQDRIRRQQLKYNGIDIYGSARMNEDELTQYAIALSTVGSANGSSMNVLRTRNFGSFTEEEQIEWALRASLRNSRQSSTLNGPENAPGPSQDDRDAYDNEYDWEIQLALKLSMDEK